MKRKVLFSLFFCALGVQYGIAQTNTFPTTGYVGIGTTSPANLLHIDAGNLRQGISVFGDGGAEAYSDIMYSIKNRDNIPVGGPVAWWMSYRKDGYFSGNTGAFTLEFFADRKGGGYFAPLSFKSNGDVVLVSPRNAQTGNVGIGTISPSEKLSVNGKIRAQEIKVEISNWPDYVFKKDYELLSLEETERFINKHGYLPDVPKASEVEANGISLGEMNKVLLKKIEEVTLHLIEKDKVLKQVIERLEKSEKELSEMRSEREKK
jgi:hypothetical protein